MVKGDSNKREQRRRNTKVLKKKGEVGCYWGFESVGGENTRPKGRQVQWGGGIKKS